MVGSLLRWVWEATGIQSVHVYARTIGNLITEAACHYDANHQASDSVERKEHVVVGDLRPLHFSPDAKEDEMTILSIGHVAPAE